MSAADSLIGREAERARLDALIDQAIGGRGGSIVVLGEAGVGKSSLVEALIAERGASMRLLRLTGVEVESDLAYAGLATLVAQADRAAEDLEPAHAEVVRSAMGLGDRTTGGLDVHLAALSLLSTLGTHGPVLLVVDDVQWIDRASLGLLTFVARRVADDPVAVVLAGRPSDDLLPAIQGIDRLDLAPLSIDDGVALLVGRGFAPPVAAECWRATGGNPLALVELAAALGPEERSGSRPLPDPIPVAGPIREVFARRLAAIDASATRALAIAAVDATGDASVVAKAMAAAGVGAADLRAAEDAGFIDTSGGAVRWEHPLARAAVLDALDPASRRAAHRVVAGALDEQAHGARIVFHLAAAAEGPDEDIANRLEEVALLAADRGANSAAAAAWEAAAALSLDDERRFERVHAGLEARWSCGESENVVRTGRPLVDAETDATRRVRLALMVGQAVAWWEGPIAGSRYLCAEADRVAAADPLNAGLLYVYAASSDLLALRPRAVIELAGRARDLATEAGDVGLPLMANAMEALGRLLVGEGDAGRALLDPLGQLCPALLAAGIDGAAPMSQVVSFGQIATEQWEEGSALLTALIVEAERTGYVGMQSYAHDQLGEIEFRQGRWAEAASRVAHTLTLAEGHDQPIVHQGHLRQARLDACRGRTGSARTAAETAMAVGQRTGLRTLVIWAREVLALAALGEDDTVEALHQFDALSVLLGECGVRHPGLVWWQALYIETLAAQGRTAEASAALERLRADTATTGGRWAASAVARGEAAVAVDGARAVERLDEAVALLTDLGAGFDLAQAQLARGQAHRRLGQGEAAARDLAEARGRFEHLDARPWADRAARMSDPAEARPAPSLASILTDGEMRVALAVGSGLTNREAADQLFLSVKTVDSHLQSIYRRLEIRSRSQLAALVARELGPAG